MSRLTLMHSFLDRFEERLEADSEQLKRQLLSQVDKQFGALRGKVSELRVLFGGNRMSTTRCVTLFDDPPVETVQLDKWMQEQRAMMESVRDVPSTSTGRKRKSSSTSRSVTNKRQKTIPDGSKKYRCKSPGCGKSFPTDFNLISHEHIHLGIKPFSCTWPGCRYSSNKKSHVVRHVRFHHFKLPMLQKDQAQLNIVDNRNPEDYVRVDTELLQRRLE